MLGYSLMENRMKEPGKKTARTVTSKEIREKYEQHVLEHGTQPASFYLFARSLRLKEEQLYQHYNSFESIEKDIWRLFCHTTIRSIESEEVYREYAARERLLSFYYTLAEELKKHRSYILWQTKNSRKPELTPYFLRSFKAEFVSWAATVIKEGQEKGEIVNRPLVGNRYGDAMWLQTMFLLRFWVKDDSPNFEKTDAAIEKAVNLAFDIMGRGAIDSLVDFGKFLFQNRQQG